MSVLPWHENLLRETAPAPAMLLTGAPGAGLEALALALAAKFKGGAAPAGYDADLLCLQPEEGKSVIAVDAVREILAFFALAPVRADGRAAVILRAECLHAASANMLLKVLEEPPPRRFLILAARAARNLPATVLSRCRIIAAGKPPPQQARDWLRAQNREVSEELLAFCGGLPYAAMTLPAEWPAAAAAFLQKGANMDVAAAAAAMTKNAPAGDWLDALQKWTADMTRAAHDLPAKYFPARAAALQKLARGRGERCLNFHRDLCRRRALAGHPMLKDLFIKETLYAYRRMCAD